MPRRWESGTEDSADATTERQTNRHVVEDSQPEHDPDRDADQHADSKPSADGRRSDILVVCHTVIVPNEPPETRSNTANLQRARP
ncbi:hypothetical protein GCM10009574_082910 [Streptomyces asiaticus]|uniref:Uncharacterized protein n=1 Tax=Streptomyces rhizosphaericus TaxID=114699 RepID=A0ABP4D852_9ACTN